MIYGFSKINLLGKNGVWGITLETFKYLDKVFSEANTITVRCFIR